MRTKRSCSENFCNVYKEGLFLCMFWTFSWALFSRKHPVVYFLTFHWANVFSKLGKKAVDWCPKFYVRSHNGTKTTPFLLREKCSNSKFFGWIRSFLVEFGGIQSKSSDALWIRGRTTKYGLKNHKFGLFSRSVIILSIKKSL